MKLISICVLYNPDIKNVINNIKQYITYTDQIIIWDNSEDFRLVQSNKESLKTILSKDEFNKIVFMGIGKNVGLSFAYNKAIEYASLNSYTHIMTMDQDSVWIGFDKFKSFADNYFKNTNPEAIIGPSINENKLYTEIRQVPNIINSGAIIPLAVFKKIGGYCSRFLVDAVDVELCYRAYKNGISTFTIYGHGYLKQQFGNMSFFNFNGRRWYCTNYSPFRLKGITRNHTLLARIYPEQEDNIYRLKNIYLKQYTIAIILKEKQKFKKLFALYSGLIEGLFTTKNLDNKFSKA